jgi:cytidylate kinase
VVAIDGPAGAGKSTVAKQVAQTLGFSLVDTGALYRAVALAAKERQLSVTDHARIGALAAELVTTGALRLDVTEAQAPTVILDGTARTTQLRSPDISQAASVVSAIAEVRAALLAVQRDAGAQGGVVLEGRDIGTVVFPHADVKVFLTADDHERARRRLAQLGSSGVLSDMDTVLREVRERDQRDAERDVAPMRPADDAVTLDCSALSAQQVIDRIVALVRAVQNG